jgi:malic enzyme
MLLMKKKGLFGLIYTPGVAYVATEISNNKELVYDYTSKWNNVAIICDGTRVLGLGNIGLLFSKVIRQKIRRYQGSYLGSRLRWLWYFQDSGKSRM